MIFDRLRKKTRNIAIERETMSYQSNIIELTKNTENATQRLTNGQ